MMLCQLCNKNPATIHIQENVNGQKQEMHLCLECAGKRAISAEMFHGMDLTEVLETLEKNIENFPKLIPDDLKKADAVTCPNCSWTGAQLRKTGRLGCPECYHIFEQSLIDRCLELHRSAVHTGKLPELPEHAPAPDETQEMIQKQKQLRRDLETLEQDLRQAVRREEYGLAAQLRDQIAALRTEKV